MFVCSESSSITALSNENAVLISLHLLMVCNRITVHGEKQAVRQEMFHIVISLFQKCL